MIYFITPRKDHDPFIYKSQKITVVDSFAHFVELMQQKVIDFDTEFNGKRYFLNELLLLQFGTKETKVVIDFTELSTNQGWRLRVVSEVNSQIRPDHLFIGHNLKAECHATKPFGFNLPDLFDTMIAEQRLNMGKGLLNNYKDTYERRLKKFFPEDKEIRKDFCRMNKTSKMYIKHIMYAAGDVGESKDIATIQKDLLSETNQAWFVRNVEFPLIKILADIELKGLYLDETKWKNLIQTKKQRRFECMKEMDQEIVTLGKGKQELLGGKFNNKRKTVIVIQPDLFGGESIETENQNIHNINYNSTKQVPDVIKKLGLPIPTFVSKTKKEFKKSSKQSVKKEALNSYIIERPLTPIRSFLEKLLEYKGLQKFVSSYGPKFLNYEIVKKNKRELGFKNPFTQRVHTVLKQAFTSTGRLSSGDVEEGLFNIQNLPAEPEVRECFSLSPKEIEDGYYFSCYDLSGAELIFMAALADDQYLYELGADRIIDGKKVEGDLHSPTATKCWRAVYQYRKSKFIAKVKTEESFRDLSNEDIWSVISIDWNHYKLDQWFTIQDSKGKKYILTEDFTIIKDKKHSNYQVRTDFKSYTFGTFYGMMAKKGGETLNIPKEEAQVMIDVIKKEFPKTFKMLENATNFALRHGYVIFNKRSNNRRYFQPVLDLLATIDQTKYSDDLIIQYVKEKLDFSTLADIQSESKNAIIQGSQADAIKESMVELTKHNDYKACEASLLLSVHDEIGGMHKDKTFGERVIKTVMIDTCNKYLELYSKNIRMGADGSTTTYWKK